MACFANINIGDKFGRLEVIRKNAPNIIALCNCGKEILILPKLWNKQKSCGCIKKELGFQPTHGQTHVSNGKQTLSPTYTSWRSMRARCYNKNSDRYPYYGGRGIAVCQEWLEDFECFLKDMGERPTGTTLDRIDVNGNYTRQNCRWAKKSEQARNTRNTRYLTLNRETKCIATWSEELGINIKTLENRIRALGWSDEKALTTPAKNKY